MMATKKTRTETLCAFAGTLKGFFLFPPPPANFFCKITENLKATILEYKPKASVLSLFLW